MYWPIERLSGVRSMKLEHVIYKLKLIGHFSQVVAIGSYNNSPCKRTVSHITMIALKNLIAEFAICSAARDVT